MAATTYKVNKTLRLDGKTYFRSTEAELELPDELRERLVKNGTIAVLVPFRVPEPAAPAAESAGKKAK